MPSNDGQTVACASLAVTPVLPVVKDNTLYGIITSDDLVKYLYEKNKKDPMLTAMGRFKDIEKLD
jgi:CBS domain-containing protein